jgi:DNA repair protein RadA/Sms
VAAALISALSGVALDKDCVYFGEVSLSGAVRPVRLSDIRLREAAKLGFGAAIVPASGDTGDAACGLQVERIGHLNALAAHLSGAGNPARLTTA